MQGIFLVKEYVLCKRVSAWGRCGLGGLYWFFLVGTVLGN